MFDVILDTVIDCLKLLPFLFLTYLVMEYLEHKTAGKVQRVIQKGGHLGPLFGGVLGVVPQCGFSAAASNLYAGRVITLGTLIAIYLSTSDEMLPILISEADKVGVGGILKILALKAVIGIIAGFIIDLLIRTKEDHGNHIHEICEHDHCHCAGSGIFKSALIHTGQIAGFILLVSFALNVILYFLGGDALKSLLLNKPVIGVLLAGLVGLIPNCAASVVLTQLYVEGAMSFAACMSGLLVGAGIGLLVLFRANRNKKENIMIVVLLYIIGVCAGLLMELLGFSI
ncbi:MAG TPA: putative manganese transporter [Lachnospiraceae bacterium]|nr:putative manganese transporter [Lachnospiraceae bacterium]